MLVLLLLATGVSAEWVEISQHHNRGEPVQRAPTAVAAAAAADNNIYANYSLTERSWHRPGSRITNVGSVRKVQLQGINKERFSVRGSSTKTTASDSRFESIGSVKIKENMGTGKVKRKPGVDNFEKDNEYNVGIHNPSRISDVSKPKTVSEIHELFITNNQITERNKYQEIIVTDADDNNASETSYKSDKVNLKYLEHVPNSSSVGILNDIQTAKNRIVNIEQYSEESEIKSNPDGRPRYTNTTHKTTKKTFLADRSSPADTLYKTSPNVEHIVEHNFHKDLDRQNKLENTADISKSQQRIKHISDYYADPNVAEHKNVNSSAGTKPNTVEVIWKLMKVVADNISRNTRRSFRSKIRYLEDLQNNIVANIAECLDRAWPDDMVSGAEAGARRRRGAEMRGHVEFPSSESALMTISFLTFAVFLIKLVLQVIHTYKNKTMMVTPAVVAAVGRAAATLGKQVQP